MSAANETKEVAAFEGDGLSPLELRAKIDALEQAMFQMHDRIIEIETKHHFTTGIYAREIFIPKGTTLTGKIHRTEHLNIISQGEISVMTEGGIKRLKAPCTIISKPGTKRVGYAHEDTVWTTIHGTNETDLEKLEAELIAANFEVLEQNEGVNQLCHG